jgi:hypothetical protein
MIKDGSWIQGAWQDLSRPECRPCVEGADCSAVGTTVPTLVTQEGWWRAGIETIHFDSLGCEETTCVGATFGDPALANMTNYTARVISGPSDVQCVVGQAGLMCLLCDKANRYVKGTGAQCIKCTGNFEEEMTKIATTTCALFAVFFLFFRFVFKPTMKKLKKRYTVNQLKKAIYKRQMKVKILLAFVQVGSRLQGTFRIKMPKMTKKFFTGIQVLEFFDVFSLIMRQAACSMDSSYYSKVFAQTLGPLFMLVTLYILFAKTKQAAYFDLLLFVSFIVYAPTSAVLISYFDCYPAWHGGKGTGVSMYLLADPFIKCTDEKYLQMAILYVLPMCFVFVVGFPLYYATLLWADRATIMPKSPNPRFQIRLKSARNKVIPTEAVLKLALAEYFGFHPTKAELEVLFSYWSHQGGNKLEEARAAASFQTTGTTAGAAVKWQSKLQAGAAAAAVAVARTAAETGGKDGAAKPAKAGAGVGKCAIKYAVLSELFEFGARHHDFVKRRAGGAAGQNEIAPVLENVPPALRSTMQSSAIRAYATVVTKSDKVPASPLQASHSGPTQISSPLF